MPRSKVVPEEEDDLLQPSILKGSSATNTTTVNDSNSPPNESTHLEAPAGGRSYGSMASRRRYFSKSSTTGKNVSRRPVLDLQRARSGSFTSLPFTTSPFRDLSFARLSTRPISSYDQPLEIKGGETPDADAKVNGIRVWYSSFTSIDWLHDTIKDSARFAHLRRRKSVRSRLRLIFDKSLGWIIVTIVGFLTALVAFFVVRSEQLLFDLKEGYCTTAWWKATRFCCPHLIDQDRTLISLEERCPAWRTWANALSPSKDSNLDVDSLLEYVSYTSIAVCIVRSPLTDFSLTWSSTFRLFSHWRHVC